jgi:hypothetical protein
MAIEQRDLKRKLVESDNTGGYKVVIGTLVVLVIALSVVLIRNYVTNLNGVFGAKTKCEYALDLASAEGTMGAVFDKCFVGDGIITDEATGKIIREW